LFTLKGASLLDRFNVYLRQAVAILVAVQSVGGALNTLFGKIATDLTPKAG